ncbi:Ribosomal protein L5 eukaryotic/L18 archaeal [Sesbania bispinosa]|nr:Ribosomal protein L5 eukaryotic/L18 archaeal [Sesbania bispinosa]
MVHFYLPSLQSFLRQHLGCAGKTDYRARIRLINQDKNKYNTPKYRFVVRFTNKDIIAQVVSASIAGDIVLAAAAYAHELPRYGLQVGLTNYAAAYCTGLLLARRVLKMLEMDEEYEGMLRLLERIFQWNLLRLGGHSVLSLMSVLLGPQLATVSLVPLSSRWGLDIPHSEKRFAGFDKEKKDLDAETLMEDEPEKYQSHFSEYIKQGIEPDGIEELYKKVHAAIRADPLQRNLRSSHQRNTRGLAGNVFPLFVLTLKYNLKKLTYEERKAKLIARLQALNSAAGAADDDEDDE